MAKTIIIYSSPYGTTKKYAEWIAEELNGDIYSINNFKQNILNSYDTIIIGSGLYAGKIKGIKIITRNYEILKNKKLIIFTCGLADYSKTEHINVIYNRLKNELSEKIIENIKIFYLRGGIDYKKLTLKHKIMMWVMKKVILKNGIDKLNEEDKEFIETYGKEIYFLNKNSINELLDYCR
jgi:menaquinone-dependent protoporphyrinogen IX oxidase